MIILAAVRLVVPRALAGSIAAIAIGFILASFGTGAALAAGLIEPATGPEAASAAVAPRGMVRDRYVRLDLGYMEANVVPRGIDRAANRLRLAPAAGPVTVDLFPGVSVTMRRTGLQKAYGGGYVWTGRIPGDPYGFGTLVVSGDEMTAQIQHEGRVYRITPAGNGLHRVIEIDTSQFPGDIVVPAPEPQGAVPPAPPDTNPEARTNIRVLVPYTTAARSQSGNIGQDANLAIALSNQALKNSGILAVYRLAGTVLIRKYKEVSFETDLNNVTDGKGPFKAVHSKRNATKADLVAMLRGTGEYCGIGWYVVRPSASTAQWGFSVTGVDCVPHHTAAHEMGHNSGLLHDRYVEPAAPKSRYNFGFVNLKDKVISVMAYHNRCTASSVSCTRVPMFSTPLKKWQGSKLGIPKGTKDAADASRRLDETRKAIAGYR